MFAAELSRVLVVSADTEPTCCSMENRMLEEARSLLDDVCWIETEIIHLSHSTGLTLVLPHTPQSESVAIDAMI
jgi:hypothetical protein